MLWNNSRVNIGNDSLSFFKKNFTPDCNFDRQLMKFCTTQLASMVLQYNTGTAKTPQYMVPTRHA